MAISQINQDMFASQVDAYDISGLRADEEALIEHYCTKPHGHILVIGCGAGRTLLPLVARGFEVTAIDIVPEMVERARIRASSCGVSVSLFHMDASALTFPDATFDYVFAPFHVLSYVLPHPTEAIKEASRVLKPDGVFIGNMHNRFYVKKLHRVFVGAYDTYHGIETYRTTPCDTKRFLRFFHRVQRVGRISTLPYAQLNWKDRLYRLLPFFDKSTYYVCSKPRR